jgi:hypothetical protein
MGDDEFAPKMGPYYPPLPVGYITPEWNITDIAPPAGRNRVVPVMGFRDFYNLRSPVIPKDQETPEMRNLKAWKDANFRMPFHAVAPPHLPTYFSVRRMLYEFGLGFFFGSIFAAFWHGPPIIRLVRRIRRGELENWAERTPREKLRFCYKVWRRFKRIPMLFGIFQMLLRGMNPTLNGYMAPWLLGSFLIGVNHMRRKRKKRLMWTKWWDHYRQFGDVHDLEHRPLWEGTFKEKWRPVVGYWLRSKWRKIWKGVKIILVIEILLLAYRYEGDAFAKNILKGSGFQGFGIAASPTFGADPPELTKRALLQTPTPPPPVVDGGNYLTEWLWRNNAPGSGNAYVIDRRMFSIPDLKPILQPLPDQLIKFDPTALKVLDNTPAFLLGQQDWRSSNAPTGRHEPMVRVGALSDGRYILQRICLETLVELMAEQDPRWVDPSHQDIAADILHKAAEDERILGKIYDGQILTDNWEEQPHKPLIVSDWNKRLEKEADRMIAARTRSWSNFPIWAAMERLWDSSGPNPPTYSIEDGPGGYQNITPQEIAARRQYVMEIDPKAVPNDIETGSAPVQFFKRLRWKRPTHGLPPGLPEGMPVENYVHMREML